MTTGIGDGHRKVTIKLEREAVETCYQDVRLPADIDVTDWTPEDWLAAVEHYPDGDEYGHDFFTFHVVYSQPDTDSGTLGVAR